MPYDILKKKKNINVDGAYDCDLLCKLIVDYIPSDSVKIVKEEDINVGGDSAIATILKKRKNIIINITGSEDENSQYSINMGEGVITIKQGISKYTTPEPVKPVKPTINQDDSSNKEKLDKYSEELSDYNIKYESYKKTIPLYEFDQKPEHQIIFNSNGTLKTQEKTTFSAHLEMDAGNFVNYKDTSYEGTKCFFFMPSRHTIDGEQFDLELNIYHGSFDENLGYSAHYHYHHDTDELGVEYHQHMHYHKEGLQGTKDAAHSWGYNKEGMDRDNLNKKKDRKNTVLCLLFNRGDHKGTKINTFFDQFVHSDEFNNPIYRGSSNSEIQYEYSKIKTSKHFSFDDLLPKRRSFFNYETRQVYDNDYFRRFDGGGTKVNSTIYGKEDEFEVVVFDYIQTIDKAILDIISNKAFAAYESIKRKTANYDDIKQGEDFEPILYKKNIEVITDERYKKLVRLQIKDLVSMTRVVQSKPPAHEPKEYYKRADDIYAEQRPGGAFYSYQSDQVNAIGLSNQWEKWGRGDKVLKSVKDILQEAEEQVQIYKSSDTARYLSAFNTFFSNVEFNTRNKNYLQLFESMYSSVILKVLKQKFKKLGLIKDEKDLIENEKNLEFEYATSFSKDEYLFDDKTYLTRAFHPEVIDMENIRKNLYLYNKIFVLKKIYYVRNDRRYHKFFSTNRNSVNLRTEVIRRTKVMLRDTISELMIQSFPKSKSVQYRIFDSKIYSELQSNFDIIVVSNSAFIEDKDLDKGDANKWHNLSMKIKEAFKYARGGNLNDVRNQGANFKLNDINIDMKGSVKRGSGELRKKLRDVGFDGGDEGGKFKFDSEENGGSYPTDYSSSDYGKPIKAFHNFENIKDKENETDDDIVKKNLYKMIMSKKNLSAGVLSDSSTEFIYHYEVLDIGQITSNDMEEGVNDDNVLKIWRYFIQLNENGYYDYTDEFDIFNENFIGESGSMNILKTETNEIRKKIEDKSFDNIKNRELFGETNEDDDTANLESDLNSILNKTDSIIPIKNTNLIDNFKEIIVKVEKKKSIIMFNILKFLSSGKENEKFRGNGENIFFLTEGPQMKTTIDGDECQKWNSHEVHQEGSLFSIFKSIFKYPQNGKIWPWMDQSERLLIQDGLLVARGGGGVSYSATNGVIGSEGHKDEGQIDVTGVASEAVSEEDSKNSELLKSKGKTAVTSSSIKWTSHNFCRNPGNYMPAPWCYTKNPNVRWQYCIQPDYSQMIARITLLVTFLFIVIIAYLSVRRIFENELFTAFIARLTGGQASQGAGPQGAK